MAIQIGHHRFRGKLGSVIGSQRGDKAYIKEYNPVSKERLKTGDNFKRFRENGKGFGGGGRAARALMDAWVKYGFHATDGTIFSRLNGAMFQVQRKGPGTRGYQTIQPAKFGRELLGFELAKDRKVATALTGTPNWDYDPKTGRIRLWLPENATIHRTMAPQSATHATLRLMVDILSDYEYCNTGDHDEDPIFLPKTPENNGSGGSVETPPIPLTPNGAEVGGVLLEMTLPFEVLPHQSLVLTWGVAYWNFEANGSPMINRNEGLRRKKLQEGAMQILTIHPTDKPRHHADADPLAHQPEPEKPQLLVWEPGMPETHTTQKSNAVIVQQIRLRTIHDEIPIPPL